jgi:hypothetical protein
LYSREGFGTVGANTGGFVKFLSTSTRQTISDLGTIAAVVGFLWMLFR